jgi:hypothetical protein
MQQVKKPSSASRSFSSSPAVSLEDAGTGCDALASQCPDRTPQTTLNQSHDSFAASPTDSSFRILATYGVHLLPARPAVDLEITSLTLCAQAFENTSTNIAAAQMRNELTKLAETVKEGKQKQVCDTTTTTSGAGVTDHC